MNTSKDRTDLVLGFFIFSLCFFFVYCVRLNYQYSVYAPKLVEVKAIAYMLNTSILFLALFLIFTAAAVYYYGAHDYRLWVEVLFKNQLLIVIQSFMLILLLYSFITFFILKWELDLKTRPSGKRSVSSTPAKKKKSVRKS